MKIEMYNILKIQLPNYGLIENELKQKLITTY